MDDTMSVRNGSIVEQIVGQELIANDRNIIPVQAQAPKKWDTQITE